METITGLGRGRTIETAASQRDRGIAARADVSRSAHATYTPVERDPVALIEAQNTLRLPGLLQLRRERMSASPFTFYRGTAGLMALDLSHQAMTGVHLVISGDAHLANFGLSASPERRLVFDLNDFDEAAPGPWEWDIKRLVTSVVLGGLDVGIGRRAVRDAAMDCVAKYRTTLRWITSLDAMTRYYTSVDEALLKARGNVAGLQIIRRASGAASKRTSAQVIASMTTTDASGRVRFVEDPPVLTHVGVAAEEEVEELLRQYRRTIRPDLALLLSTFTLTDIAMRVVGVGSVGTRCFVLALAGPNGDHIVLQVKEALPSVVTANVTPNETTPMALPPEAPDGLRVVTHQHILQAVSDPFLGHLEAGANHFYVRQFRDMKASIEIAGMSSVLFTGYVEGCAGLLARAHGQSPMAHWVAGYLGDSDTFDEAVVDWAYAYADQVREDFARFTGATAAG